MKREKFGILSIILDKTIFGFLIVLISLTLNFVFSQNSFAEYKATLSASVSESTVSIDGTEIIESSDETAEHEINLKINTTNKTGYTATLSAKTDETALLNTNPAITTKISSISSVSSLSNLPANTWGYSFNTNTNFNPIPALSAPANLIHTTAKSTSEENHTIKLGMKLDSSLKPGNYENKLIISVVSNPYTPKAVMTEGSDFNEKLKALETATDKIEHFKKSPVAPTASMNAVNIEDEDSDYEIKLWLDQADKTAYYYAETEKVYLNENSNEMFYSEYGGQKIKNILDLDLSSFDTSKVTNMHSMFEGMSNLTALDLSSFDTSQVTNMSRMFDSISNLTTFGLSNFNTSNVTDMSSMFAGMRNLTTLDLSNFDTSKVTDMSSMFYNIDDLTSLNLSNFNTSKVTDMQYMFSDMDNLTSLNLSNFDTSQVTDMQWMFRGVYSLTTLDLSNFDTSQVMNMQYMFSDMRNLTTINLSNFNTSKVTDMSSMFDYVDSLTTLDLSNFDTSQVTDMDRMFNSMSNLTTLDLSNFDTSQVTDMGHMFFGMSNLTTLDLSNFDTSQVTDMDYMFALHDHDIPNDKLETIYVNNDFDTTKFAFFERMFGNRKKLRGGNGSYLADPSTADETWLRVDRPGVQGYFTRKP